jgi:PIN domain nuclease of toxin-antitoxin system
MLSHSGRLKLHIDVSQWVGHALERPKVELLPFTPTAAIRAAGLGRIVSPLCCCGKSK